MGRAIVREPSVFLMDEPLSNLDAKLRVETRANIAELQARLGTTTVYVTHDQVEAMTMGHRVAVLKDGLLQQCDTPRTLYDAPANVFVAGFMGSPAMNLLTLPLVEGGAQLGDHLVTLPRDLLTEASSKGLKEITFGIRPENLILGSEGIPVTVDLVEELGADSYVHGHTNDGGRMVIRTDARVQLTQGATIKATPAGRRAHPPVRLDHRGAVGGLGTGAGRLTVRVADPTGTNSTPGVAQAAPGVVMSGASDAGPAQPAISARRRRATSASTTPAATEALSDSTVRAIGIDTVTSQTVRVSRASPRPSEPTTSTSGEVASSNESVSTVPSASRPATISPAPAHSLSVRTRLVHRPTRSRAAVPAEVRHADAVIPAERRSGTSTPCAPNAAAERTIAPRLRGSVTPSTATSSGACPESAAIRSRSSGWAYSYGGTCRARPWWMAPPVSRSSSGRDVSISAMPREATVCTASLTRSSAGMPWAT